MMTPGRWRFLEMSRHRHSMARVVLQRVRLRTLPAEPEVLDGMGVGWETIVKMALRKAKKLSVPMVE